MINKILHEKNTNLHLLTLASIGLAFTLASNICQAALVNKQISPQWYSPVLTLSGGWAATDVGRSQTLTMANDYTTYQYSATHSDSESFILGVYAGNEIVLNSQYAVQMGIGFYGLDTFSSAKNRLVQGVDLPSSDEFSWHYKVKNQSLLAEAKLLGTLKNKMHPYLTLGLGAAFNQAYDFTVTPPTFLTFTPEFTNHTQTSFTYVLGIGIDADVSPNCRIGLGYRFANLGQANLGKGFLDNKVFSETLRQSNLYMHSVLAQLTWRFGK